MQEKKQNNSPFKQRISQFVEYLGISKREFYNITGISRGTIENETGITEDTLAKLFATYKDLSREWILLGTGEMIKKVEGGKHEINIVSDTEIKNYGGCKLCAEKDKVIASYKREIETLTQQKEDLRKAVSFLHKQLDCQEETKAKRNSA